MHSTVSWVRLLWMYQFLLIQKMGQGYFVKIQNELVKEIEPVDLAYFDPPYNQHPYGSNYFMLNIINGGKPVAYSGRS